VWVWSNTVISVTAVKDGLRNNEPGVPVPGPQGLDSVTPS